MRFKLAVPLALLILPSAGTADVFVKAQNERITVRAQREPLSRVLAGIAREAGISVVNPSSAPSQLVSVNLEDVTPQEALIRLFDGQGLNYIFQLDPSGSRVAMLILASGSAGSRSSSSQSPAAMQMPAPQMYEEEQPLEDEPEPEEEIVLEQPGANEEIQPQPEIGISGSSWNPPGAVIIPQPGSAFPGAVATPYPTPPGFPAPNFPGGASNVNVPPPPPSIPRFPGGGSQPQPQP